jgi:hypothetical protein
LFLSASRFDQTSSRARSKATTMIEKTSTATHLLGECRECLLNLGALP